MKNCISILAMLSFFSSFLFNVTGKAQTNPEDPRYIMVAKNFRTLDPSNPIRDSIARFEIWMQQTNQGEPGVNALEYAAAQFTWTYNRNIQRPGDNLYLSIFGPGCELPSSLRPVGFQVDSVNGYLKLSGNLPNYLQNFFISGKYPGTRILTVQIRTSANYFPDEPFNLRFKLGPSPNTFVGYFLPYPDSVDSEQFPSQTLVALMDTINPPATPVYSVDCVFPNCLFFPVEMSGFISNVNKNNVTLNWSTTMELNNQGFDIERQDVGSEMQDVWVKAGYVAGNGNSTETKSYAFSERLNTGRYKYRLKQIDFNGGVNFHSLQNEVVVGIPATYSLSQNYPNPFNPTTKIDFELPHDGKVNISLYDISGREVAKLVNEVRTAGYHTIEFNGSDLSSGMYFYRINAVGGGQNFAAVKNWCLSSRGGY
ncbi:MAG: T9SS type A sorting domain-containing protein [Ignavibacteria bacterium]|nr:T9SS type A sorting domain-containing protein [Ignavibacteria bacterium]